MAKVRLKQPIEHGGAGPRAETATGADGDVVVVRAGRLGRRRGRPKGGRPGTAYRARSAYVYILAAFAYLAVFVLYPMGRAVYLSLTNTNLLSPTNSSYVGLANYRTLFAGGAIDNTLKVTAIFVVVVSLGAMLAGVVAALLIEGVKRGRTALRLLLALPWAIPSLVAGLLFALIFDQRIGVVNRLLVKVGAAPVGWLTNDTLALWAVIFVTVWNLFPFVMLVTMAALAAVPSELAEAAAVDGAGYWETTRRITLPSIAPTLRVIAVFLVIWAFQQFQVIWIMTQGGPINGTDILSIDLYRRAFLEDNLGPAAALGVVGLIPAIAITVIYFRLNRKAAES